MYMDKSVCEILVRHKIKIYCLFEFTKEEFESDIESYPKTAGLITENDLAESWAKSNIELRGYYTLILNDEELLRMLRKL